MSSTKTNTRTPIASNAAADTAIAPQEPRQHDVSQTATASLLAAVAAELTVTDRLAASGALFNIEPDRRMDNGPIMSGSIRDQQGVSIPVALFREVAESGEIYASLALGGKDRTRYYGRLFHSQTEAGNGPAYSGYIVVLPVTAPDQHSPEDWDKAHRLQVCGWRRRSADGSARISLQIAPRFVDTAELAF